MFQWPEILEIQLADILLLYILYVIYTTAAFTPKHKTINQIAYESLVFSSQFVEL